MICPFVAEKWKVVEKIGCKHILAQKKRLGGDFAVARATPTRYYRTLLRKVLGPDLVFIVLNLDSECGEARLRARHPRPQDQTFVDMLKKMHGFYEPAGEDEENAFNITVSKDMTPKDVMEKAVQIIDALDRRGSHATEKGGL